MPKDHSADLMQSLMAKLYSTVTGDDPAIKLPRNKFVSWMMPGIPFEARDFNFGVKGLIGETAEETRELQHQAWTISKLFDFVPEVGNDPSEFIDVSMQQTIWSTTQDSISSVYRDILRYSRVVNLELSEKEKKKLQKFRDLLTVEVEEEDLITEEKRTVTKPGKLTLAYTDKMNEYIEAADEYINVLIDAQSAQGNDPEAIRRVAAFANKSKFLRKKMEAAEMAWIAQGYKNEYEQINAYINQVTMKSMVLYKQDLLRKFDQGMLTSTAEGQAGDFYYTALLPGNGARSKGWTNFTYYDQDYESHFNKKVSSWSAKAGFGMGLFSIGAKASGSKTEVASDQKSTNFRASLEFTQVPICRPWFDPGFFSMRGWDLDKLWDLNYGKTKVSDGKEKPVGRLIAYPVQALFVRNAHFKYDEWENHYKYMKKQISGGGSVGWGPFSVGGSYSRGSEKRDFEAKAEGGGIRIPGIQLIGFINNLVPKCPDLHPDIKPDQLVGGEQ